MVRVSVRSWSQSDYPPRSPECHMPLEFFPQPIHPSLLYIYNEKGSNKASLHLAKDLCLSTHPSNIYIFIYIELISCIIKAALASTKYIQELSKTLK